VSSPPCSLTEGMLRLMGLPTRARCPNATVRRALGRIELRFLGPDCDEGLDVDLGLLGPDQDPEAAELSLLAQLKALGYAVERLPPDEGD
jgi:hypothetical protein